MKQVRLNALKGRVRKRAACIEYLHINLRDEFERLRKICMNFNYSTLNVLAMSLLRSSDNEIYGSQLSNIKEGKKMKEKLTFRWIKSFADRFKILNRSQTG